MNWNFLISFGIGLGVYLLVVVVIGLIKRHKNKKLIQADKKEFNTDEQSKE